jgi:hypothetical protein
MIVSPPLVFITVSPNSIIIIYRPKIPNKILPAIQDRPLNTFISKCNLEELIILKMVIKIKLLKP